MHPSVLTDRISDLIEPVLEHERFELVDVVFRSESGRWVLRVFIDKPQGVNLEDCASISRRIGDVIDVEDIIPHGYSLEVSSPGLDRVLKKERDFQRFAGRTAKIVMKESREGRKNFKGIIVGCSDGVVQLEDGQGGIFRLDLNDMMKANLEIETSIGRKGSRPGSGNRKKKK